jgi:hypothetical protein
LISLGSFIGLGTLLVLDQMWKDLPLTMMRMRRRRKTRSDLTLESGSEFLERDGVVRLRPLSRHPSVHPKEQPGGDSDEDEGDEDGGCHE